MGKSKRKHILNAALKALIAGAETSAGIKIAATFISELASLPEDKQKALGGLSQEKFNQWVNEYGVATAEVTEETRDIVKDMNKKVDALLERHKAELKEEGLKVLTAKLPVTGKELFGREKELELLDDAWGAGHTHIVSLVAWGGVGKSALVNEWLNRMEADNWRGAERVYGWSFYSQGTREDRQASGDEFLAHALEWFGDEDPAKGSPWDKGVRLAGLVRQQRTLLVLDGMEPLQYPPGVMEGRLKDQGLQALCRELARSNNGLCVISTRENVADIENTVGKTTRRVWLENLSDGAGAQVLENLGVKGTKKELADTSREFKGHALALNLLGSYLATVHGGEIRKRDLVPGLEEDERQGGHAKRVMESYEIWLEGKPELDILNVTGLFDRPADEGAIKVLREGSAIKGLTENIVKLSEAKWKFAVKRLRDLRLLAKEEGEKAGTTPNHVGLGAGRLDCHPLIREHFGAKLKNNNSNAWREAHGRLYEYFRDTAKELPDTLEEMEPLFCAVAHGCAAGRYQETHDEVFDRRIRRGNDYYVYHKLGAFGADLAALAGFFEICWSQPTSGLTNEVKALVLAQAGYGLRAVGRLREAVESMKASLELYKKQEQWQSAAVDAGNLSELYLTLGDVKEAVEYGKKSVEFADQSLNEFERYSKRARQADAFHQGGKINEAEKLFREAEKMYKDWWGIEYLCTVSGFQFCELLLSQGKYKEVQRRAARTLELVQNWRKDILSSALDKISLGRAYMLEAIDEGTGDFGKAREYLDGAVEGFREAGTQHRLPGGLIARAYLYRHTAEFDKAWRDLEEAREIAERGEMKLFLTDCALEAVKILLAQKKKKEARKELEKAKGLVEETGYHRRDPEIQELEKGF